MADKLERERERKRAGGGRRRPSAFINCYSLRSSLRLAGRRDSTLLRCATVSSKLARAHRRRDRDGRYDRAKLRRSDRGERGIGPRSLQQQRQQTSSTFPERSDVLAHTAREAWKMRRSKYRWWAPVTVWPPCTSSVAAAGRLRRETGGYDYPL